MFVGGVFKVMTQVGLGLTTVSSLTHLIWSLALMTLIKSLGRHSYGPRFPFRGTPTPLVRREWFSHGCSWFDRFDRMDRSFDRHGRMDVANPTFEEMARHRFDTFGTNPSVESFARSRSWF
jgi:hypothetical protein